MADIITSVNANCCGENSNARVKVVAGVNEIIVVVCMRSLLLPEFYVCCNVITHSWRKNLQKNKCQKYFECLVFIYSHLYTDLVMDDLFVFNYDISFELKCEMIYMFSTFFYANKIQDK